MARESVEALLSPSLKVSRPVAACARCRSAKIKCDGKLPACSGCERAGKTKECSSAGDEFARGKERSYSSALETAIQRLQRKIDEAKMSRTRKQSVVMVSHDRPILERRRISNSQRKEAGSVDELVSDFGFLTVNATSRDFQGFSETMSFAKMLKAIALKEALPEYTESSLPPRYSITHLVSYYFETVHVLLPFFSETEFMSSLSRVYQEQRSMTGPPPYDLWCFHLVLAISSASLCQMRGDEHHNVGLYHVSRAMNVVEHVIHPGSISGIQALLLLVQYAMLDPEYFDMWYIIGMASRLLVDLGLHCEPAPEIKISKQSLDLRRRVFYCTYALDRLISMSLGLAFSFTDDSAPNVLLPTLATDQEARSPTQVFLRSLRPSLFLFDIRRVQSAFYQKTRWSTPDEWSESTASSYVALTLEDVRAWQTSLPENFSQKHLQLFYLESLYSQALALSPNPVIKVSAIPDEHRLMFFEYVFQYSEQLRSMTQNTDLRPCLSYADSCRARYVSRQFQNIMWASFDLIIRKDPNAASPVTSPGAVNNCTKALAFLGNMSHILDWTTRRWGISALQEIFEQESAVLLARLQNLQQENASSPFSNPSAFLQNQLQNLQPSPGGTYQQPAFTQAPQLQFQLQPVRTLDQTLQHQQKFSPDSAAQYSNPAMHRSNLLRGPSWSPNADQPHPELPSGTMPRRSYEFRGGQT